MRSTFRQLLIYRALGHGAPAFHHCPLMTDE
jgi:glutamyl/glutaminyl-tRNA synthetase